MRKVNRLGWTAGVSIEAYGVTVGIRTNDPGILNDLVNLLPPSWAAVNNPVVEILYSVRIGPPSRQRGRRNYHLLYMGAARLRRSLNLADILETFESNLHMMVAFMAEPGRLFVHAGVVGWKGRAILIPGRSMSGKTTLVAELIKAGASYFSDDMAVLDTDGNVHPYPVPLSVRVGGGRCKVLPESLGAEASRTALPVGLVVVTSYEESAHWRPRSMSAARGIVAMMDNTVAARRVPHQALPILQRALSGSATAIKTKRGEAADVAPQILAACVWAEG